MTCQNNNIGCNLLFIFKNKDNSEKFNSSKKRRDKRGTDKGDSVPNLSSK